MQILKGELYDMYALGITGGVDKDKFVDDEGVV